MEANIIERLDALDAKLDTLIAAADASPSRQKYLTARDVGRIVGLDARTILNRSNLPAEDARYIPSLRFGVRRKYFDRRVIDRLFRLYEPGDEAGRRLDLR